MNLLPFPQAVCHRQDTDESVRLQPLVWESERGGCIAQPRGNGPVILGRAGQMAAGAPRLPGPSKSQPCVPRA